jgi:hypothetical protein
MSELFKKIFAAVLLTSARRLQLKLGSSRGGAWFNLAENAETLLGVLARSRSAPSLWSRCSRKRSTSRPRGSTAALTEAALAALGEEGEEEKGSKRKGLKGEE